MLLMKGCLEIIPGQPQASDNMILFLPLVLPATSKATKRFMKVVGHSESFLSPNDLDQEEEECGRLLPSRGKHL